MITRCEECQRRLSLQLIDPAEVLIGGECACGYYVTRYLPGQEPT